MKTVNDFIGFGKGDIITLSDLQTQREFKEPSVDFRIEEVRTYREPNDFFTYTGYVVSPPKDEEQYMILVRQMGEDFDLLVFYLDGEGDVEEYEALLTEDGQDLENRVEATIYSDDDQELPVTWDKKGDESTFGVLCETSSGGQDQKTLAEYFTNDDAAGNPHAFVEWTGNAEKGYIEVWYGCEIRPEDVEIFPVQAASANEKLAKVSSGTTALSKITARQEEAKKRLLKSRIMKEESEGGDSLADETEKALGRSGAQSKLEALRAKRQATTA